MERIAADMYNSARQEDTSHCRWCNCRRARVGRSQPSVLQCCREAVGGEEIREMQNWHLLISDYRHFNTSVDTVLCNLVHPSMSSINHGPVTATHHICYSGWIYPGLHNQCGSVVIPSSVLGAGPDSVLAPWACTQHGSSPSTAALRY